MEDFIAHNSRWRVAGLILVSLGFGLIGLWLVGAFGYLPDPNRAPPIVTTAVGWLTLLFFGLCGFAWTKVFFDRRVQLQIGPSGVRWRRWSDSVIPWSEVHDVTQSSMKNWWGVTLQRFIVLHLRDPQRFPGRGLSAKLAGANRKMTGGDICISLTGTNRSFDDAMSAIARFRG